MKKSIYILFIFITVLVLTQIFILTDRKELKSTLESGKLQSGILYHAFINSVMTDGCILNDITVSKSQGQPFLLFDSLAFPALIIGIPLSEDICGSCVDYAVNTVSNFFPDFSNNERIVVLSHVSDPNVKERVYRKSVYRYLSDSCQLGLRGMIISKPFYVIIDKDKKANMFFVPNSLMPDLTKQYLAIVRKRYFYW